MDLVTAMRAGSTVLTLLIFVGVVWWAYAPSRKRRFENDALLPFADEHGADKERPL